MNPRLQRFLRLDGVGVCPHDDSARCACRKPQPGLLLEAARVWNIDLESSFIVGDRWRDIEAGHRAGCRAIFVDYGYAEQRPDGPFVRRPLAARSLAMDSANHSSRSLHGDAPLCLMSLSSASRSSPTAPTAPPSSSWRPIR